MSFYVSKAPIQQKTLVLSSYLLIVIVYYCIILILIAVMHNIGVEHGDVNNDGSFVAVNARASSSRVSTRQQQTRSIVKQTRGGRK